MNALQSTMKARRLRMRTNMTDDLARQERNNGSGAVTIARSAQAGSISLNSNVERYIKAEETTSTQSLSAASMAIVPYFPEQQGGLNPEANLSEPCTDRPSYTTRPYGSSTTQRLTTDGVSAFSFLRAVRGHEGNWVQQPCDIDRPNTYVTPSISPSEGYLPIASRRPNVYRLLPPAPQSQVAVHNLPLSSHLTMHRVKQEVYALHPGTVAEVPGYCVGFRGVPGATTGGHPAQVINYTFEPQSLRNARPGYVPTSSIRVGGPVSTWNAYEPVSYQGLPSGPQNTAQPSGRAPMTTFYAIEPSSDQRLPPGYAPHY